MRFRQIDVGVAVEEGNESGLSSGNDNELQLLRGVSMYW
jgi:hypothetical protein